MRPCSVHKAYPCPSADQLAINIETSRLCPQAKVKLQEYIKERKQKLSPLTLHQNVALIRRFLEALGKSPCEISKGDVVEYMANYRKEHKPSTADTMVRAIKTFMRWWNSGEIPECVSWMSPKVMQSNVTREDLVTADEKERIIAAAENDRDRAIIALLEATGVRPEEALLMDVEDLGLEHYPTYISVWVPEEGKTGSREVYPLMGPSVVEMERWLRNHPLKDNSSWPKVPLFVTMAQPHDRLRYFGARGALQKACKNAGINRKLTLKLFRHTWTTAAKKGELGPLTDADIKALLGHSPNSTVTNRHYNKLTGSDAVTHVLEHEGIKAGSRVDDLRLMRLRKTCPKCSRDVSSADIVCPDCGLGLHHAALELAKKEDEKRERQMAMIRDLIALHESPGVQALLKAASEGRIPAAFLAGSDKD